MKYFHVLTMKCLSMSKNILVHFSFLQFTQTWKYSTQMLALKMVTVKGGTACRMTVKLVGIGLGNGCFGLQLTNVLTFACIFDLVLHVKCKTML